MMNFLSFSGIVRSINDFWITANDEEGGCNKLITVENEHATIVNFVVEPATYFVDHVMVKVGDRISGYFDGNAAVPMIYPPQYRALVIAKDSRHHFVKVDYFNNQLVSSDGNLKIIMSPTTPVLLENGQAFTRSVANRNLIVIYGATTRSIPAQTTPYKVIVMC